MSKWTHRVCADCWIERRVQDDPAMGPSIPVPLMVPSEECPAVEDCCACGATIVNIGRHGGIYLREKPDNMQCGGEHG